MADRASSLDPEALSTLGILDDPVRRRLFEFVRDRDESTGRDDAAKAAEISRTLAAYHLDKLVDAKLLSADYARPPGRSGPGAGRPAKMYRRSEHALTVSVPPRNYALLARLLTLSVSNDPSGAVHEAVTHAAYETGRNACADSGGDVQAALTSCGYQPSTQDNATIDSATLELRNCPFHALAQENREIVCGINLKIIQGVLDGGDQAGAHAELTFPPNRCCVTIHNVQPMPTPRKKLDPNTGRHVAPS